MAHDGSLLKDIGDRCSLQDCKEFDFLQIKCDKCAHVYCKNHILPDLHDCSAIHRDAGDHNPAHDVQQKRSRCALEGCTKLSLESFVVDAVQSEQRQPAVCPQCGDSFCIEHRHPTSHKCPRDTAAEAESAKNIKNQLARSLLAKHFPTPTLKTTSPGPSARMGPGKTPSSDPKQQALAQRVQAMKMRQRAVPGDPKDRGANVPLDQKLYVQVGLEGSDTVFVSWFRKDIIVGRVVDLLATHFKLRPPLQLAVAGGHSLLLNSTLGQQIADGASLTLSGGETR